MLKDVRNVGDCRAGWLSRDASWGAEQSEKTQSQSTSIPANANNNTKAKNVKIRTPTICPGYTGAPLLFTYRNRGLARSAPLMAGTKVALSPAIVKVRQPLAFCDNNRQK